MRSPTCISFDKQEMAQFTAVDMITESRAKAFAQDTNKNLQEYAPDAEVTITAVQNEIHLSGVVTQAQKDYYDDLHTEEMRYITLFTQLDEAGNPTGKYEFGITISGVRDLSHVADCLGTLYICSR